MKDCVLNCVPTVCCFKAKWLGLQFLYIQFQSVAALKIRVKSRFIWDGRPLERCDGLDVVMLKALHKERLLCLCLS